MKLSLRELDHAVADPQRYLQNYISSPGGGGGPSAMRYWQYAVYHFHRSGSLADAIQHFEALCQRSFVAGITQQQRLGRYSTHLREYQSSFASLHHTVVRTSFRVAIALAPNITASAEVGRIDMTPQGGYAFCLLLKAAGTNWQRQLRMPLIQHLIAAKLRVHTDLVQAGVYSLEDRSHEWHLYSAAEIRATLARARRAGSQIVAAARQLRYTL